MVGQSECVWACVPSFSFRQSNVHPIISLSISMIELMAMVWMRKWCVCAMYCVIWINTALTLPPSSPHQHYQQNIVITLAHPLEKLYMIRIVFEAEIGIETWKPNQFFPMKMFGVVESKSKHNTKCRRLKCWAYHFTTFCVCMCVFTLMVHTPFLIRWWNHI